MALVLLHQPHPVPRPWVESLCNLQCTITSVFASWPQEQLVQICSGETGEQRHQTQGAAQRGTSWHRRVHWKEGTGALLRRAFCAQQWWWHPTWHSPQTPLEELILHSRGLDPEWAPEGAPGLHRFGFRDAWGFWLRLGQGELGSLPACSCGQAKRLQEEVTRLCSIRDNEKQ